MHISAHNRMIFLDQFDTFREKTIFTRHIVNLTTLGLEKAEEIKCINQITIDIDFVSYGYFDHSEINSIPNHISYPMK